MEMMLEMENSVADDSNGLWGFKSSTKRLPRDGLQGGLSGGTHHARIRGCIGPLARSRRDMELFMWTIMNAESWKYDSSLLPLTWRESNDGKGIGYKGWSGEGGKLRVGVMYTDGRCRPVSSIKRAMDSVVGALEGLGELVEMEPRFFEESWELVVSPAIICSTRWSHSMRWSGLILRPHYTI